MKEGGAETGIENLDGLSHEFILLWVNYMSETTEIAVPSKVELALASTQFVYDYSDPRGSVTQCSRLHIH